MSPLINYLMLPYLLAMFLAVNMGASGTSPAFSAAYGANIIRRSIIPGLFGSMVLLGAIIAGKEVTMTMGSGILAPELFDVTITSIILASIGLSLLLSNLLGIPQSTSQAAVLAIAGAALALGGFSTNRLFYEIIPTWFILPVIAFTLMYLISKYVIPSFKKITAVQNFDHIQAHPALRVVVILSSLYVAFAIGANNVANAAGPIASLTMNHLGLGQSDNNLPVIILSVLIIAPCFAIGSSLLGHKVTQTTGKEIVDISPVNASIIAILTATLLLLASTIKGIPTSLVQLNTAAFIALSISKKGYRITLKNKTVKRFFIMWVIAPLIAFALAYTLTIIFNPIIGERI